MDSLDILECFTMKIVLGTEYVSAPRSDGSEGAVGALLWATDGLAH